MEELVDTGRGGGERGKGREEDEDGRENHKTFPRGSGESAKLHPVSCMFQARSQQVTGDIVPEPL